MPEENHSAGDRIRSSHPPIDRIHVYADLPPLEPLGSGPVLEPRIDDLLMKVAETEDLRTLATVHLRIASTMICIQHLEVFLPNLVVLDLNGSELSSLRDLGTQLRIKSLNVSRCGLHSLDGTTGLSTLVELVADENAIRGVEQVCNLIELTKLSLRGNKITTYDAVSFMCLCPSILELDLRANPVTELAEYREYMTELMPALKLLDGQAFYDAATDESLSSSEYCSSTSDPPARSGSRGSSVVSCIDVAHDTAPISGNIVSAVRRRKSAWTTRSNSAASSNGTASSPSTLSSRSSSSLSGCGGPLLLNSDPPQQPQ